MVKLQSRLFMSYYYKIFRNAVNQLTIYALALASRTKLTVKDFKCSWFDDRHYFEFFPLHAVYEKVNM